MTRSKEEFIKSFLPECINDINYAQINLDISDLSIADILRNINKTYPINSRNRNAIASGELAVGILCKSESLDPMSGLFLVITNDDCPLEIVSSKYIVIAISESKIKNNDSIKEVVDNLTKYLIKEFREAMSDFVDFYVKFVYDEYEMEYNDEL